MQHAWIGLAVLPVPRQLIVLHGFHGDGCLFYSVVSDIRAQGYVFPVFVIGLWDCMNDFILVYFTVDMWDNFLL